MTTPSPRLLSIREHFILAHEAFVRADLHIRRAAAIIASWRKAA